jgi:hypothetical protein
MNVTKMLGVISSVSDSVIMKSLLPDLHIGSEFGFRPKRKSALDILDRLFELAERRDQNMDVIGHQDECMEEVGGAAIVVESVDEQLCPAFVIKKRLPVPGLGRNHAGLAVVSGRFSLGNHSATSGAKAPIN